MSNNNRDNKSSEKEVAASMAPEESQDEAEQNEQEHHQEQHYSFLQRQAMRMARYPKTYFWVAFIVSLALSVFAFIVGEFSVSNEEGGWQSRGTLIADRQTQVLMVIQHQQLLAEGSDEVWKELTNNVQPGWEADDDSTDRRRLMSDYNYGSTPGNSNSLLDAMTPQPGPQMEFLPAISTSISRSTTSATQSDAHLAFLQRRLQQESVLAGCDIEWYTDRRMTNSTRLWPVWRVKSSSASAISPTVLEELCLAEVQTQRALENNKLCLPCGESTSTTNDMKCLPPYSPVLYARLLVSDGMSMDCTELAQAWEPYQTQVEQEWTTCVNEIESTGKFDSCSDYFHPALLDEFFDETGNVQYTSSIFATTEAMLDDLYDIKDQFGRGTNNIEAAYDTNEEDFINILFDTAVNSDMLLATGSALITTIAILIHTRSLFLSLVGLVQIILSFPLAFFVYRFICGFTFFPFLNFIGVFVVFALGADHVFVAVDKWKNARNDHPEYTTEQVAAKSLPDAAVAMFLTTSTTAIAFFATAICPVAPVRLFAIFCGLLITFDYIMDVLLIFPCLCIYDGYRDNMNCCISFEGCRCFRKKQGDDQEEENENEAPAHTDVTDEGEVKPVQMSLIRRILFGYYNLLHRFRWPLFAASTVAFAVCCYFASQLRLPLSSDVRLLRESVEFEQSYQWRLNLLSEVLEKQGGSLAFVVWGTSAADTGDQSNPDSWSTLELDDSFDPSSPEAQQYMVDFCPAFFAEDFAGLPGTDWNCPINLFDAWLRNQSTVESPEEEYESFCNGASGLPMAQGDFHGCFTAWARLVDETMVLSRNGVVEIMFIPFNSRVRYDSPNSELDSEWNLIENWIKERQRQAPKEVSKAFHSSADFWWYDTNQAMFATAYGSAAIALAAAAAIILLSSRSFVMTLFSVTSIGYVLVSVTSMMVAAGWSLGFLESVCFAILIGVSVDFIIHLSHAYVSIPGEQDRCTRTKHALIEMGPSILAAAFTTIAVRL